MQVDDEDGEIVKDRELALGSLFHVRFRDETKQSQQSVELENTKWLDKFVVHTWSGPE